MTVTLFDSEAVQHILEDEQPNGIWLTKLIASSGFTKSAFCKIVGLKRQHLNKYERGIEQITGRSLANLRYCINNPTLFEEFVGLPTRLIRPIVMPQSYMRHVPIEMIGGMNARWDTCANPTCGKVMFFTNLTHRYCSKNCTQWAVRHRKELKYRANNEIARPKKAARLVACPGCGLIHTLRGSIVWEPTAEERRQADDDYQKQVERQKPGLPDPVLLGSESTLQPDDEVPERVSHPRRLTVREQVEKDGLFST